jgi:hypothetical protein
VACYDVANRSLIRNIAAEGAVVRTPLGPLHSSRHLPNGLFCIAKELDTSRPSESAQGRNLSFKVHVRPEG